MEKKLLASRANDAKLRYNGFTLLESLLALFLFSVICLLASGYIRNAQVISKHLQNASEKEWHIFLIQLENELEECTLVSVMPNQLLFFDKKNQYEVLIEFKQKKLIKSANGGYQPLLTQVETAVFIQNEDKIALQVCFENDKNKEAVLIV